MQNKIKKLNTGYTIIETMIAISLFLVIVTAGMGALLNANLLHNKSQDIRSLVDSLGFIMEDISRNLRTGTNYHCIVDDNDLDNITLKQDGSDCEGIAFINQTGYQWVYVITSEGRIIKTTESPFTPLSSSNYVQLTPDEVVLNNPPSSGFTVIGAEESGGADNQQPFVTIKLSGVIHSRGGDTPFSLQTSVSQRGLDI